MSDNLKVFIVGSARSGTSITYFAVREVFQIPGTGESHVFPIYVKMLSNYKDYIERFAGKTTLASRLDLRLFRDPVIDQLRSFYATHYPEGSFVDKTPGSDAINGVPLILSTFPDAKIVLTKRTGIEVISSYGKKFKLSFNNACITWSNCMSAISRIMEEHPETILIDQFDIANKPHEVAEKICLAVGLPEKISELTRYLQENEKDRKSTHSWDARLTIAETGWTDEEIAIFGKICGDQMRQFGYEF